MSNVQQVTTTQQEPGQGQRAFTFQATQLIYLAAGLLEAAFALRVFLKLIAANPDSPFASFLYGVTGVFLAPFAGLTGTPASGGMVLEISTVIAMVVYAVLAWVIERVVWVIFFRPRSAVNTQTTTTNRPAP